MEFKNNYQVIPIKKNSPEWQRRNLNPLLWLRIIPKSVALTEAEIKKIIEDAFDAGKDFGVDMESSAYWGNQPSEENKEQYIEQFKKK